MSLFRQVRVCHVAVMHLTVLCDSCVRTLILLKRYDDGDGGDGERVTGRGVVVGNVIHGRGTRIVVRFRLRWTENCCQRESYFV